MAGVAIGVAAVASASGACGVSGEAVALKNHALVGTARVAKRAAVTCEAKSASQSSVQSKSVHVPVQSKAVGKSLNPAEELLQSWARQPAVSGGGRSSETEAVRRLFLWEALPKKEEVQVFSVYEINEHDRDSPAYLPFSAINVAKFSSNSLWSTLSRGLQHGIGDLVPFSNKIYDSSLQMRLGVTAGMTMVVNHYPGKGQSHHKKEKFFSPDRYEAMYTFYMGDLGHVSAQGPFVTFEDTLLTITGGAGLFREAKGVVHLHNITPFKLFYTFHVRGVPELPSFLTKTPVQPGENVQPCREAVACKPGFALPNYTD